MSALGIARTALMYLEAALCVVFLALSAVGLVIAHYGSPDSPRQGWLDYAFAGCFIVVAALLYFSSNQIYRTGEVSASLHLAAPVLFCCSIALGRLLA